MRVLVHLGLNKCASTYIQSALASGRSRLARAGVCYPVDSDRSAHYGLSRHYGFGPVAESVQAYGLGDVAEQAKAQGASCLILSSEYLSIHNPAGANQFVEDLRALGWQAEFQIFGRDPYAWVRSLFNQYVKTVETGRYLPLINEFVDQVLANRSIDVARRVKQWSQPIEAAGFKLSLFRIPKNSDPAVVLRPFEIFAKTTLSAPQATAANIGLGADTLYQIGKLRRQPPSAGRNKMLAALLSGGGPTEKAPEGYLKIDSDRQKELRGRIIEPFESLDWTALPQKGVLPVL